MVGKNAQPFSTPLARSTAALLSIFSLCILLAGLPGNVHAQPALKVDSLTWSQVGLDATDINVGPNEFAVGARVINTGTQAANNLRVTFEFLPGGTGESFISVAEPATLSQASLAPGTSADFCFTVSVQRSTAAIGKARPYRITATADAGAASSLGPLAISVEALQQASGVETLGLVDDSSYLPADLTVIKTASADPVQVGEIFYYKVTVLNLGPCCSEDVILTDTLPKGVTFLSAYPAPNYTYPDLLWKLGAFCCNTSRTVTIKVKADCDAVGDAVNKACVKAKTWDFNPKNNCTSETVKVVDKTLPDITCPPDKEVCNDPGKCSAKVNPGKPVTDDNCATKSLVAKRSDYKQLWDPYPVGTTKIYWCVFDKYYNKACCEQKIIVKDCEEPDITCPPDITTTTLECETSITLDLGYPVATDNCKVKDIFAKRSDYMTIYDPFPVGTTIVTWCAVDYAGNKACCEQKVTVVAAGCDVDNCTYTQGYWKNHPDAWPVNSLKLGNVTYTKAQLLAILKQPVKGNGLVSLAHQLIAAKLNIANGADPSAIAATIAAADALIGNLVIPPIGSGYLHPSKTSALTSKLDQYNSGLIGPGHCDDNDNDNGYGKNKKPKPHRGRR